MRDPEPEPESDRNRTQASPGLIPTHLVGLLALSPAGAGRHILDPGTHIHPPAGYLTPQEGGGPPQEEGAAAQGFTSSPANDLLMDRKDLMRARHAVPDLQTRWSHRRQELENQLEIALDNLAAHNGKSHAHSAREAPALYRKIARIDRSISLIDRALVHLDDIEKGTHHAQDLELAPASPYQSRKEAR